MRRQAVTRSDVPRLFNHRVWGLLGLRPPIVQLSREEQHLLVECARGRRRAVELGVAEGGSAWLIADVLAGGATLDLVDPFFPGVLRVVGLHELIARRLLRGARPEVRFHKVLSWEGATLVDLREVDFLFIDADHTEEAVRRDWAAWEPLLAQDATVLLHDAIDPETGGPGPIGPGLLLRDLLANGWRLVGGAGVLAAVRRDS